MSASEALSLAPFGEAISPREELIAYEALWGIQGQTEKRLAQLFHDHPHLPSQVLRSCSAMLPDVAAVVGQVEHHFARIRGFSICVNGMVQYPSRLRDARHPVEMLYGVCGCDHAASEYGASRA